MTEDTPLQRLADLSRLVHREVVLLLILCGVAAVAFLATQSAAAANRSRRVADAAVWHERGLERFAAGQTVAAISALRHATAAEPETWAYARSLSVALVAHGDADSARQVLLLWRQRQPEDPEVNTQLARLEARSGDVQAAASYYESALYGVWGNADDRRRLHRESIAYLIKQGEQGRALSQVLALSANQTDDVASHLESARLFLRVGDPGRALDHFVRALQLEPRNAEATAGAGQAAFALNDYGKARGFLNAATDPRSAALKRTVDLVFASDPLQPGLSFTERRRRLIDNLDYARGALDACLAASRPAPPRLSSLSDEMAALEPALERRRLQRSPETIDRGVRLVYDTLSATGAECPPAGERDDALLRVGLRHGAAEP